MSAVDLEITLRAAGPHYAATVQCTPTASSAPIDTSATPALIAIDQARLRALALDPRAYGLALGQMVLADPLLTRVVAQARAIAQQQEVPLRVRLTLAADAAELHTLRWEALRDPDAPDNPLLTAGGLVSFSRYLSSADWQPVRLHPSGPQRALAVLACPSDLADYHLTPFDTDAERLLIERSLGALPATVLAQGQTTLDTLTEHLRDGYDILYLLAHGRSDETGETWLYLEGQDGLTRPVRGSELATRIAELRVRPQMVILGSCESAGDGHGPALLALGPRLAQMGVGAVLAMQDRITQETLGRFLPACLRAFQRDGQIDAAVAAARGTVRERPDFWVPVLFLRVPNGRLWDTLTETSLRRKIEERLHTNRAALRVLLAQVQAAEPDTPLPPQLRASLTQLQQRIADDKASLRGAGSAVADAPEDAAAPPHAPAATGLAPSRQPPQGASGEPTSDPYAQYRAYLLRLLPPLEAHAQPYLGLQTFQFEHADRFFGRDALVAELAERLGRAPFLAVLGASGSGKSSVVRAGLLPLLRAGGLPGSEQWQYVTLRPGSQPLDALVAALCAARGSSMTEALGLATQLAANAGALLLLARMFAPRLVLVVDQAEELWTLQPVAPDARALWQEQQQRPFLRLLLSALSVPDRPLLVILALRTDFLHRASDDPAFASAIADHDVIVSPMTGAELRAAISLPARQVGGRFEPGLVDELIAQTEGQGGALPLLEYTLQELWALRQDDGLMTWACYHALGGIEGALARRADNLLQQRYTPAQQDTVRRVLLRLIQPGEDAADTRRRVALPDLAADGQQPETVHRLLQPLIDARLLTTSQEHGRPATVEVSHEALIRSWPTLRGWIDEARADLRLQLQLEEAAREWQASGQDASLLWDGLRLSNAEAWVQRTQPHLGARDAAFLEASRAEARRQQETAALVERDRQRLAEERRNARRLRSFLLMTGVLLAAAIVASVAAVLSLQQTEQARDSADVARAMAVRAQVTTKQLADVQRLIFAAQSQRVDSPEVSLLLANEVTRRAATLALTDTVRRSLALETLVQGLNSSAGTCLHVYNGTIDLVAFSPRGQLLATGEKDGSVRLWRADRPSAPLALLRGHTQAISALAFSPDGQILASASDDATIQLWRVEQPDAPLAVLRGHTAAISALAFSPDGQLLATASDDTTARLWQVEHLDMLPTVLSGHNAAITALAFSPDGRLLTTASDDATARLWRLDALGEPAVLRGHTQSISALAFSPDGALLATTGEDGDVRLWQTEEPLAEPAVLSGDAGRLETLAFSPDGATLAAAGLDPTVRLWQVNHPDEPPEELRGHEGMVRDLAFSRNGAILASASNDGTIRLWRFASPSASPVVLRGHEAGVRDIEFSPDGATLASASNDGTARLWRADDPTELPVALRGLNETIYALAFSPDGATLATAPEDGSVKLWRLGAPSQPPTVLRAEMRWASSLAFSPDGRRLAAGSDDGAARLWRLDDPAAAPAALRGHDGELNRIAFSPDGRLLATSGMDGAFLLWHTDAPSGEPIRLRERGPAVYTAAFSPDGRLLASASEDSTVQIWQVQHPGAEPRTLRGHEGPVYGLAFSPDGRLLASGGDDSTVRLWRTDALDGVVLILHEQKGNIMALAFSPGGSILASANDDGSVRLRRVASLETPPTVLRGLPGVTYSLAFSPDGRLLASTSEDGTALLWRLHEPDDPDSAAAETPTSMADLLFEPTQGWRSRSGADRRGQRAQAAQLVDLACRRVGRNFALDEWRQYIGADEPYRKLCPDLPRHPDVYADLLARGLFGEALLAYQEDRSFDPTLDPAPVWLVGQAAAISREHPLQALLAYTLARWRDPQLRGASPLALAHLCEVGSERLPAPALLDACDR